MGTSFETIETRAMMYIKNDISLDQDLSTRLPLFYNRMKAYLMTGKSYFNKPPQMTAVLSAYTEPNFEEYISQNENIFLKTRIYRIGAERQYIELERSESISNSSFVNIFHESEFIDRRKSKSKNACYP